MKSVDIVLPCFNESESLPNFLAEFVKLRTRQADRFNIGLVLIDNGSTDSTYDISKIFATQNVNVKCISLSRNFGKEASLTAGLDAARGDACIPMDCDLQDPMEAVDLLLDAWVDGVEVVLAKRKYEKEFFNWRIITSNAYLKLFNRISDSPLENSVGEFRLMSRKVIEAFGQFPETERFTRGLFAWMGFRSVEISYTRGKREYGKSKFNFIKLCTLGIHGVTSFSIKPLRVATYFGLLGSVSTFIYAATLIFLAFRKDTVIPGYASTLVSILLLGSIQFMTIGILGEYVGKTLLEAKRRPVYLIQDRFENNGK